MVGHGFWREFREWVLAVNPNAYITAELWWEDFEHDKMYAAGPWLAGDQFDAVMNYRWAEAVRMFFVDCTRAISPTEFDRRLAALRDEYRSPTNYGLMNLLDSHDTDRIGSMAVNPDHVYDHAINPKDDPTYNVRAPRGDEVLRQRAAIVFQFTYLGAPMIYYGDEVGMWGADDPDDRKPMVWADMRYEPEASDPRGRARQPDAVRVDVSLLALYQQLGRIRASHRALRRGTIKTVLAHDARRLYAFAREYESDRVVAVFNGSAARTTVELPAQTDVRDLLDERVVRARNGSVRIALRPYESRILASMGP
jgi:glycosidase